MKAIRVLKNRSTGASIVVLSCIESGYSELLASYLIHQSQIHSNFNTISIAGASLGVIQSLGATNPTVGGPNWPIVSTVYTRAANWGPVFLDQLALSTQLNSVSEIWVFEHLNCKAYTQFQTSLTTDTVASIHVSNLITLKNYLKNLSGGNASTDAAIKALHFKGFILEENGKITLSVDDGQGIKINGEEDLRYHAIVALVLSLLVILVGVYLFYSNTSKLAKSNTN